jgi:hypothetical protein
VVTSRTAPRPARAGAQPAGRGVGVDVDTDAVDLGEPFGGQHVLGRAVRDDPPPAEQCDPVGDGRRLVQVVQDDADRDRVVVGEVADQVEEFDLVAQVETGGRLVEQQHSGLLGEAAREPHPLELSAGQLLDTARGQVRHTGQPEHPVHHGGTAGVGPSPAPAVWVAAELDDVADAQAARRGPPLGQECDAPRELPGLQAEAVGAVVAAVVQRQGAAAGTLQPRKGAQQRRLPAAVRTHERGHLGGPDRDRRVVHDIGALVGHRHSCSRQPVATQT